MARSKTEPIEPNDAGTTRQPADAEQPVAAQDPESAKKSARIKPSRPSMLPEMDAIAGGYHGAPYSVPEHTSSRDGSKEVLYEFHSAPWTRALPCWRRRTGKRTAMKLVHPAGSFRSGLHAAQVAFPTGWLSRAATTRNMN